VRVRGEELRYKVQELKKLFVFGFWFKNPDYIENNLILFIKSSNTTIVKNNLFPDKMRSGQNKFTRFAKLYHYY
jgi:hypothetical protein